MSIGEKLSHLSNNALFATVAGGLLVIAITAVITTYVVTNQKVEVSLPGNVETVKMGDLELALRNAKERVEVTGYFMSKLTPDYVSDKMNELPRFTASVVLVNPLSSVVCQRQNDEDSVPRNYQNILLKFREFRQKSKSMIGQRLKLGVADVYPTMAVLIIDDDLYAYFYPYKGLGTTSPVLKFKNFSKDERAKFFETHLRSVFQNAKFLSTDADYKPYEAANLKDPCF